MGIQIKSTEFEGFKFLQIDSSNLSECLKFLNDNRDKYYGICCSNYHGFEEKTLDILQYCPWIKGLVVNAELECSDSINRLSALEFLQINSVPTHIDFGNFKNIKEYRGEWSKHVTSLLTTQSLKSLALWKMKSKDKNLSSLEKLRGLESLELIQSNILNLQGVENLRRLRSLEIAYCRDLNDIYSVAELERLESVHFQNCKKIKTFSHLKQLYNLNRINIENCGLLDSLSFCPEVSNLKELYLAGTSFSDDDLNYLFKCQGLEKLFFNDKKTYSIKLSDIKTRLKII